MLLGTCLERLSLGRMRLFADNFSSYVFQIGDQVLDVVAIDDVQHGAGARRFHGVSQAFPVHLGVDITPH